MAEGFCRALGRDVEYASAGSHPGSRVHPDAVAVMKELGIDIAKHTSKGFAELRDREFDYIATMGCKETCPFWPGARELKWQIPDGCGRGIDETRRARYLIRERVTDLLAELGCLKPDA
jgi:arsenate reductase